jgi:ecotin
MKVTYSLVIAVMGVWLGLSQTTIAQTQSESEKNLAAFPAAKDGMHRAVIHLPALPVEDDARLEIIAGRTATIDCNISWFGGSLIAATIDGWGFDYYTLHADGPMVQTRKACPEGSRHEAFVPVRGEGFMLRYNSRLPVVIYAKDGFEIRYRVWTPSAETRHAPRG